MKFSIITEFAVIVLFNLASGIDTNFFSRSSSLLPSSSTDLNFGKSNKENDLKVIPCGSNLNNQDHALDNDFLPGLPDGRLEPTEEQYSSALENEIFHVQRASYPNKIWIKREGGVVTIPYYIRQQKFNEEYGFSDEAYKLIISSLKELSNEAHAIKFRYYKSSDESYILFKKATNGCSSTVGYYGGYQDIWLASRCENKGSIHHEAMHALGFGHEMNRPDRDDHVTIKWNNIYDGWEGQYSKSSSMNSLGTPYDYYSVMHYSAYSNSKNGKLTIDAGKFTDVIGQRNGASDGDILQVKLMYQCSSGPRHLSSFENYGCTSECLCSVGQGGCGAKNNNNVCRDALVCENDTCKTEGTRISSMKRHYTNGEKVRLTFHNPANDRIWISVFSADADPHNIKDSSQGWTWPCGSKTCDEDSKSSGKVSIGAVKNGNWRAYMMVDMYVPYESVAYTEEFQVGGCDEYKFIMKKGGNTHRIRWRLRDEGNLIIFSKSNNTPKEKRSIKYCIPTKACFSAQMFNDDRTGLTGGGYFNLKKGSKRIFYEKNAVWKYKTIYVGGGC